MKFRQISAIAQTIAEAERLRLLDSDGFLTGTQLAQKWALEERARHEQLLRSALGGMTSTAQEYLAQINQSHLYTDIDRFSSAAEIFHAQEVERLRWREFSPSAIEEARKLAEVAQGYKLDPALTAYRTAIEPLTSKLLYLPNLGDFSQTDRLSIFTQASTVSDIIQDSVRFDDRLQDAMKEFCGQVIPYFDSLKEYGRLLDAAGLQLRHWPHSRLITIGEKRRRFRARLKDNTEPRHATRARSVAQRYETTLRQILDEAMAAEYGDDWPEERLPLCECKDLLRKWGVRGGEVLDHADYAHYERIMVYPDHFEAVFAAGFETSTALTSLIKAAGKLRAQLQHFHPFDEKDLRDLRLTWRAIETGLLGLTADYEVES
jgi:hypothetical protein